VKDVDKIPGVGQKARLKIIEILETGTSSRIAAAEADEQHQVGRPGPLRCM
jgi:hypothetical protein